MDETATAAPTPAPTASFEDTVRAAVLAAASTPQSLAKLKTAAKAGVAKKDRKAAEAVVDKMVEAGELHKQSAAKSAPYGKDKPPPKNDPEKVRNALFAAAATPQTLAKLVAAVVAATKADKPFVTEEANKLVTAGQLHKHPPETGRTPLYGREPPPSFDNREKVIASLLSEATKPAKLPDLIKTTQAATKASKEFVTTVANELIATQQLHKHPPVSGRTPLFGRTPPPQQPPLETSEGKAAFTKVVNAARKLLESVKGVSTTELLRPGWITFLLMRRVRGPVVPSVE